MIIMKTSQKIIETILEFVDDAVECSNRSWKRRIYAKGIRHQNFRIQNQRCYVLEELKRKTTCIKYRFIYATIVPVNNDKILWYSKNSFFFVSFPGENRSNTHREKLLKFSQFVCNEFVQYWFRCHNLDAQWWTLIETFD